MSEGLPRARTMGVPLSVGSFKEHVELMGRWGKSHRSAYVCCVNVHMCIEAHEHPDFMAVVERADLATADGMPMLRAMNETHGLRQERVAGNDLMPALMAEAEREGLSIYLYGGKQEVLDLILTKAGREFPKLRVAGTHSPPFRALGPEEWKADAARIAEGGAHIVLVSLGCPRQERWMAEMKGKVPAVMVGVGGAFLLYAGLDTRAPKWMRDASLEWVYRLALEPGRLWKRYLVTNSKFLWLYAGSRLGRKFGSGRG
jgi:N-acetylglucosaminyldiphosphoundecaprenol N-acetyl-beta-D-mannosaminyltransferase